MGFVVFFEVFFEFGDGGFECGDGLFVFECGFGGEIGSEGSSVEFGVGVFVVE